jgi:pimeloyl-ACP methyl ester carboxylesterase
VPSAVAQFEEWQIALHGRRAVYRIAGSGPAVVLIHGMLNSSSHWQSVALELARDHTVLAPGTVTPRRRAATTRWARTPRASAI